MTYGYPPLHGQVTGEAVALELRPARLGSRTAAFALDLTVEFVLLFLLSIAWGAAGIQLDSDLAATFGLILFLFVFLGYPVLVTAAWRGRTLGKAALGLRVVRDDGGPAAFTAILMREGIGFLLEKPGITVGLCGIITMTSSERAKRVGDMAGGTVVIAERVPGQELGAVVMPPPLAAWAATVDLSRMPDSLGLAVRQFLGRAAQLDPAARERVGGQLAAQVAALTSPPPPPGTPGWAYLTAILAERRRRDELRHHRPSGPAVPLPPPSSVHAPAPPPPAPPGPGGFSVPT